MLPVSVAGGLVGAALLLATPARLFDAVIPFLLLLATLTFAFGARPGLRCAASCGSARRRVCAAVPDLDLRRLFRRRGRADDDGRLEPADRQRRLKAMAPARVLLVSATNGAAVMWFIAAVAVVFFAGDVAMCGPARYWQRAITPDHPVGSVLRDNPNAFVSMNLKDT